MTIISKVFKNKMKAPVQRIVNTKRITDCYYKTSSPNHWLIY